MTPRIIFDSESLPLATCTYCEHPLLRGKRLIVLGYGRSLALFHPDCHAMWLNDPNELPTPKQMDEIRPQDLN